MSEIRCRGCGEQFSRHGELDPEIKRCLDEDGWSCPACGGDVIEWPKWDGSSGADLIAEERQRQIEEEGWSQSHDAAYVDGELCWAAVCYASPSYLYREQHVLRSIRFVDPWPWDPKWDKRGERPIGPSPSGEARKHRIRELTKAGALIAAEIDRLKNLPEEDE